MSYPFFSALLAQVARIYNFQIAANMAGNSFASEETLDHISEAHPMKSEEDNKDATITLNNVHVLNQIMGDINK